MGASLYGLSSAFVYKTAREMTGKQGLDSHLNLGIAGLYLDEYALGNSISKMTVFFDTPETDLLELAKHHKSLLVR